MEPGGFDELDIKLKIVLMALIDAVPGFDRSLARTTDDAMTLAVDPLERYALADILEFLNERKPVAQLVRL